jgi:hypothetical protein
VGCLFPRHFQPLRASPSGFGPDGAPSFGADFRARGRFRSRGSALSRMSRFFAVTASAGVVALGVGPLQGSQGPMTSCAFRLRKPDGTIRHLTLPVVGGHSASRQIQAHFAGSDARASHPPHHQVFRARALIRGPGQDGQSAFHRWVLDLAVRVGMFEARFDTRDALPGTLSPATDTRTPVKRIQGRGVLPGGSPRREALWLPRKMLPSTSAIDSTHEHTGLARLPETTLSLRFDATGSFDPGRPPRAPFGELGEGPSAVDAARGASVLSSRAPKSRCFTLPPRRCRPRAELLEDL